jgi:hypothetical protein
VTSTGRVGRQVANLLGDTTTRVALIAPFIKRPTFEEALAAVPASVEKIDCVTRWSPAEVAAGVSDPEIIETAQADSRIRVRLCPPLHAKIYISDDRCLVGSANLTATAVGSTPKANIELLVEVGASHPEVKRALHQIDEVASDATLEQAFFVREQAAFLESERQDGNTGLIWYPETRRPENLYLRYSGRDRFTSAVRAGITRDLALLDIPAGLREEDFNTAVAARLQALPEIRKLTEGKRLSSLELQAAVQARSQLSSGEAHRTVETLAAWLRYFASYYARVGSWELLPGREHA